jgi:hypothetical protein
MNELEFIQTSDYVIWLYNPDTQTWLKYDEGK